MPGSRPLPEFLPNPAVSHLPVESKNPLKIKKVSFKTRLVLKLALEKHLAGRFFAAFRLRKCRGGCPQSNFEPKVRALWTDIKYRELLETRPGFPEVPYAFALSKLEF
ncbi:MAG: hypothetical protein LBK08_09990 [Treponema sp.]|nr:hypothetical protein [Treponema sp.]